MQSQRHANSVSDIYVTDEVELLLDEIRELEPTSYCAEDIQDFEIAGSVTGGPGGHGRRSPAATEQSWDSHAHYKHVPPPRPASLAPLYCYIPAILSCLGLLRLTLILCCLSCCGCLWGVVGLSTWRAPLPGRIRFLMLASLSTVMLHTLFVFLSVTRLTQLFPFRWSRVILCGCLWSVFTLIIGGSMVLHAILVTAEYTWAPPDISALLISAGSLGLCGALCAGACCVAAIRSSIPPALSPPLPYRAVPLTARPP